MLLNLLVDKEQGDELTRMIVLISVFIYKISIKMLTFCPCQLVSSFLVNCEA